MSILLADNALLTLAEAVAFLNLGDTLSVAQESLVNDCVNRVSSFIEELMNRPLAQRAYTSLRLPSRRSALLFPPAAPISIAQTITLSLDGTAQTVWKSEADGDPADFEVEVRSLVPGALHPSIEAGKSQLGSYALHFHAVCRNPPAVFQRVI